MFLVSSVGAVAQQARPAQIDSLGAAIVANLRISEQLQTHITTDKSVYKTGESLWFRVFLLYSVSQKVAGGDNTVFVDLVNEKNAIAKTIILHGNFQQLSTGIFLSDSLPSGYYWLRAYTRSMSTHSATLVGHQPLYIYNKGLKVHPPNPVVKSVPVEENLTLNFYPEGGSIITGVPSTVAVRVSGTGSNALPTEGYVKDNRDTICARFRMNNDGLGKFSFEPYHARKYTAYISWKGKVVSFPLPPFNAFAAQVAISLLSGGSAKVRVMLEDSLYRKDFKTNLLVVAKDSLCFASTGSGNYELSVPAGRLPAGVSTFFLLDNTGKTISERSVYVAASTNFITKINKEAFGQREKATIDLWVSDASGAPAAASFSLSITGSRLVNPIAGSERLLDNWNLSQQNELSADDADLLMMTRKPVYSELMQKNNLPVQRRDDSLLYLSGILKDKNDIPLPDKIIMLLEKKGNSFFDTDTTDSKGRFCFTLTNYPDSSLFSIRAVTVKPKQESWKADVDPINYPVIKSVVTMRQELAVRPEEITAYIDSIEAGPVAEVLPVAVTKSKKSAEDDYLKAKRISSFSRIITGKSIETTGGQSVSNAVLSLPGLHMSNGYLVFSGPTKMSSPDASSEPLVVVDGVPSPLGAADVSTPSPVLNYLNSLNSRNIDFIEVFTGPEAATYGVRGGTGVISVNTKPENNAFSENDKDITLKTFYAKGFSYPRPFSAPSYEGNVQILPGIKDDRSTLYWNSNIITDKNGKASASFFTNDIPGKYLITIRGVTAKGDLLYKQMEIEVR